MLSKFKMYYPKEYMTEKMLIGKLKDKEFYYGNDLRCARVKGCFTNIKFQNENHSVLNITDENHLETLDTTEVKYTDEYVNSLLQKIKELEGKLKIKIAKIKIEQDENILDRYF